VRLPPATHLDTDAGADLVASASDLAQVVVESGSGSIWKAFHIEVFPTFHMVNEDGIVVRGTHTPSALDVFPPPSSVTSATA